MKLLYMTKDPVVAMCAERHGVDRIWVDLEKLGKEERQAGLNSVKSDHSIEDVKIIRQVIHKADLVVRINPLNDNSQDEIDAVIENGADYIMLPMFKTPSDVETFVRMVDGRAKVMPLIENREAERNILSILEVDGVDEFHIGLNDLHLSYGRNFMFELLSTGQIKGLTRRIRRKRIPYGIGGVAGIERGMVSGKLILTEIYHLGGMGTILSRSFFDSTVPYDVENMEKTFRDGIKEFRDYEKTMLDGDTEFFARNWRELLEKNQIANEAIKEARGISTFVYKNDTENLIIDEIDRMAVVSSEEQWEIAQRKGIPSHKIQWNGGIEDESAFERFLLCGGRTVVKEKKTIEAILRTALKYKDTDINIVLCIDFRDKNDETEIIGLNHKEDGTLEIIDQIKKQGNINIDKVCGIFTKTESIEKTEFNTFSQRVSQYLTDNTIVCKNIEILVK